MAQNYYFINVVLVFTFTGDKCFFAQYNKQ